MHSSMKGLLSEKKRKDDGTQSDKTFQSKKSVKSSKS